MSWADAYDAPPPVGADGVVEQRRGAEAGGHRQRARRGGSHRKHGVNLSRDHAPLRTPARHDSHAMARHATPATTHRQGALDPTPEPRRRATGAVRENGWRAVRRRWYRPFTVNGSVRVGMPTGCRNLREVAHGHAGCHRLCSVFPTFPPGHRLTVVTSPRGFPPPGSRFHHGWQKASGTHLTQGSRRCLLDVLLRSSLRRPPPTHLRPVFPAPNCVAMAGPPPTKHGSHPAAPPG